MRRTFNRLTVLIIALTVIFFSLSKFALAVTIEPAPEFISEAKKIITDDKTPVLPETLNDIPLEKLNGYKEISESLEKGREYKAKIIACLIIYKDIRKKLEQSYDYMEKSSGEVDPSIVFGGKFVPIDAEKLIENSEFKLTDSEKTAVLEEIKKQLKILKTGEFELDIIEEKAVEVKRAAIFYSNAVKKTENKLERELQKLKEFQKVSAETIKDFIIKNIRLEFRIGSSVNYSGVKKNFEEKEPILIGFKYWSEKVEGEIPVDWSIKSPDKRLKMGKMTISGGEFGEYVNIVEGKIPEDAKAGSYEVEITLFPGKGDYKFKETYNVRGTAVQITNAFVLGGNKKVPDVFKPGNIIYLVMRYKPFVVGDQKATFNWTVYDPMGNKVKTLCLSKVLKVKTTDKDIQTKYIKSKIPADVKSGQYKYQASVKLGNEKVLSPVMNFLVASDLTVQIIPSTKKILQGEKGVFRSRILGGTKPYKTLWRFDSGESSSSKDVAIILTRPGKRWVTLTVTDSSSPDKLQKTVRLEFVVE